MIFAAKSELRKNANPHNVYNYNPEINAHCVLMFFIHLSTVAVMLNLISASADSVMYRCIVHSDNSSRHGLISASYIIKE